MRKIRWIGAVLCWTVLLALSVGSIFAQETQETTIKSMIREKSLREFLERKIVCVVSEDFIKFELDSAFQSKRYTEYFELSFVPKGISLFQRINGYYVDVTIEKYVMTELSLVGDNTDLNEMYVVDAGVKVYYREWFEDIEGAAKYIRTILPYMENNEKVTVRTRYRTRLALEGKRMFRRTAYSFRRRGEDRTGGSYTLTVIFRGKSEE